MRCPKCHYISFDGGDRCRNCGYDFSLTVDTREVDLPIQTGDEPFGPLSDLDLSGQDSPPAGEKTELGRTGARPDDAGESAPAPPAQLRRQIAASPLDLPLFGREGDDAPLVTPQAQPRPPLAVRRAAASVIRPRVHAPEPQHEESALDLGVPEPRPAAQVPYREPEATASTLLPASLGRRVIAGLIDASVLGAIDAAILYFTLELCGLRLYEALLIPAVPFGVFVLMLNGAYLVAFTAAAGQTIGKMAAGIRVVPSYGDDVDRVPFGFAVVRAAAYLISVLPFGLGFIPALLGAEHRALHDRLADTRVVRA